MPKVIPYEESACPVEGLIGPCHIFNGHKDRRGYGRMWSPTGTSLVHKHVWEQIHGDVPEGLELDHRCMVKSCCNPNHLRAVTHKVNATENVVGANWQLNLSKTHCPQGHEYTPSNTRTRERRGGQCRECKACARINKQRRKKKKRLLAKCSTVAC